MLKVKPLFVIVVINKNVKINFNKTKKKSVKKYEFEISFVLFPIIFIFSQISVGKKKMFQKKSILFSGKNNQVFFVDKKKTTNGTKEILNRFLLFSCNFVSFIFIFQTIY
jgi:hypothetical protein